MTSQGVHTLPQKHRFLSVLPVPWVKIIDSIEPIERALYHIRAGDKDKYIMLGLVHFVLHLECMGSCVSEYSIGSSMTAPRVTPVLYRHNGSMHIDEHIEHARSIEIIIQVTDIYSVKLDILLEKEQHCSYNLPNQPVRQIQGNDCKLINVNSALGFAHFLTQIYQTLQISINPECPHADCIAMAVNSTNVNPYAGSSFTSLWKDPALQYVPFYVSMPGYISMHWQTRERCSNDRQHIEKLCHIQVHPLEPRTIPLLRDYFITAGTNGKLITSQVTPYVQQLQATKA